MSTFYRPTDGVAADFIPLHWKGNYHLFYLKDYRDEAGHGEGTPWFQVVTKDFVNFDDWGEMLPRGPKDSQDVWVFTGSAIERQGTFHIFYTGHNSHFYNTEKPVQQVMHATSPDLCTWTKNPEFMFRAPGELYEKDDWRDPFVFWNADANEYWMLLAARRKAVIPGRNRGCTALAVSPDLQTWRVAEPFWAPDEYFTHECPDLFRIGDWYYLVYSTFTERCVTHYRMSRSLAGPWLCPPNDTFDGRAFYAAKTAGETDGRHVIEPERAEVGTAAVRSEDSVLLAEGEEPAEEAREQPGAARRRRFVFGWLPTRKDQKDDGSWEWGGNLVVHQIAQHLDGTLSVHVPDGVLAPFATKLQLQPKPFLGEWKIKKNAISAAAVGRFSALTLGTMPGECLVETAVKFKKWTQSCGLLLRAGKRTQQAASLHTDDKLDSCYQVRLEPANQRMVIDRWPRPGDQPFMLERPLAMKPGKPVALQVFVEGSCLVVYANHQVALSCRMYDHPGGSLGLFVAEGEASFSGTTIRTRE